MKKVLVYMPMEAHHQALIETAAKGAPCEVVFLNKKKPTEEQLAEANAIIGNVKPELLAGAPELEWMQLYSAGADLYLVPGVLGDKVKLTNARGAYGLAVSEHMVAQTFCMVRHFHKYVRRQVNHDWKPIPYVTSVEGSTVLVLGMGDIGTEYARKMKALGAHVIGIRRNLGELPEAYDEQFAMESLDEILPRADIVANILPGGPATNHLFDEARLKKMKPGAYLINAGRGNAIDSAALRKALEQGWIAGAALDVTEPEPLPKEDPLWDMENVFITPHAAGNFFLPETVNRIVRIAADNLKAYLAGEELKNIVR